MNDLPLKNDLCCFIKKIYAFLSLINGRIIMSGCNMTSGCSIMPEYQYLAAAECLAVDTSPLRNVWLLIPRRSGMSGC